MTDGELTFCGDCGNAYDGANHDCPVCALGDRIERVDDAVDTLAGRFPDGDGDG